ASLVPVPMTDSFPVYCGSRHNDTSSVAIGYAIADAEADGGLDILVRTRKRSHRIPGLMPSQSFHRVIYLGTREDRKTIEATGNNPAGRPLDFSPRIDAAGRLFMANPVIVLANVHPWNGS